MSSQIPSRIPPDDEEVVVNWSSGVVETNDGDARDSSVSNVVRNGRESERAKQQANDILGKCFIPPNGYPPEIPQRVYDTSIRLEVEKITIMKHNTIDENGRIIEKDRLTHNQSYKWKSETSVLFSVSRHYAMPEL